MGRGMAHYSTGMHIEPLSQDRRIRRLSLEEWGRLPEDEGGEWVDGWLVEEEMGSYLHDLVVAWFIAALVNWAFPRGGTVTASELKFVVQPDRGRKPDLAVFFASNQPGRDAAAVRRPPNIVVEVLSPLPRDRRRDRVEKLTEYASFGVPQYWLVDPEARTLEIFELGADGHYVLSESATSGAVQPPDCEGLTLDLDSLWDRVDSLPPGDD